MGIEKGQLVFTFVNKRFLKFECPWLTRYGTQKTLDVQTGKYQIDCVGMIPETAFSVEKILKKGAYFNLNVIAFEVQEGKTVTLEIHPVIKKQSTLFVKYFLPEVEVVVIEDGVKKGNAVINLRTEGSIGWADYTGSLKL